MGARHARQRPRRSSQPKIGTLSRAAIRAPQDGHRDGGETIDSFLGSRWTQTFAKEPIAARLPESAGWPATVTTREQRQGEPGGRPRLMTVYLDPPNAQNNQLLRLAASASPRRPWRPAPAAYSTASRVDNPAER